MLPPLIFPWRNSSQGRLGQEEQEQEEEEHEEEEKEEDGDDVERSPWLNLVIRASGVGWEEGDTGGLGLLFLTL